MKELREEFFARDTITVARELVGKLLVVGRTAGVITETEAYKDDPASHAFKRTPRSELMYSTHGRVYVYFVYGNHYCLNFTCEKGKPGAVLIRAVKPVRGIKIMMKKRRVTREKDLANGPGKLCQAMGIDKTLNGTRIGEKVKVYDIGLKPRIKKTKRMGISKATDLEWRFITEDL